MKDLIVIPQYYYPTQGGLQNFTYRLCNELAKTGISITMLRPQYETEENFLQTYPHHKNIKQIIIPGPREVLWKNATKIIKEFKAHKKILVIGIDYEPFIEKELSFIETCSVLGHSVYLRIATSKDFKEFISNKPERVRKFKTCKAIIITNKEIRNEIVKNIGPSIPIVYIPNLIDLTLYHCLNKRLRHRIRNELGLPKNKILTLWTGRLAERKKIDDLLLCWHNSKIDGVLALAGIEFFHENPYFKKLAGLIKDLSIKNIHFIGPFPEQKMPNIYGCADVFAFPSSREGFCNSILEAAACKLPIIAYNVPGVRTVLQNYDKRFYRLIKFQESSKFTKALVTTCKKATSGYYAKIRKKDLFVNDIFAPAKIAKQYDNLIFEHAK